MKATILTAIFILVLATIVPAQKTYSVTLRPGQQKRTAQGEITVKFVSVTEDSRCPDKAMCVWVGNAKVAVVISNRRGSKRTEMNTATGPQGDQYGGWAIKLVSLSPKQDGTMRQSRYRALFSVERLYR
jgi:hypothetical protein